MGPLLMAVKGVATGVGVGVGLGRLGGIADLPSRGAKTGVPFWLAALAARLSRSVRSSN